MALLQACVQAGMENRPRASKQKAGILDDLCDLIRSHLYCLLH